MHCCSANDRHPSQAQLMGLERWPSPPGAAGVQTHVFSLCEFLSIEKSQKTHTILYGEIYPS